MNAQEWRVLKPGNQVELKKVLTVTRVIDDSDHDTAGVVFIDEDNIEYHTNSQNLGDFLSRAKKLPKRPDPVPSRSFRP